MFTLGTRAEYLGRDSVWVNEPRTLKSSFTFPLYQQRRQEINVAVALTFGLAGDVFVCIVCTSGISQIGVLDTQAGHQLYAVCDF